MNTLSKRPRFQPKRRRARPAPLARTAFFISPDGSDAAVGNEALPLATFAEAVSRLVALGEDLAAGAWSITFLPGRHEVDDLAIPASLSGTFYQRGLIHVREGARVTGMRLLDSANWSLSSDPILTKPGVYFQSAAQVLASTGIDLSGNAGRLAAFGGWGHSARSEYVELDAGQEATYGHPRHLYRPTWAFAMMDGERLNPARSPKLDAVRPDGDSEPPAQVDMTGHPSALTVGAMILARCQDPYGAHMLPYKAAGSSGLGTATALVNWNRAVPGGGNAGTSADCSWDLPTIEIYDRAYVGWRSHWYGPRDGDFWVDSTGVYVEVGGDPAEHEIELAAAERVFLFEDGCEYITLRNDGVIDGARHILIEGEGTGVSNWIVGSGTLGATGIKHLWLGGIGQESWHVSGQLVTGSGGGCLHLEGRDHDVTNCAFGRNQVELSAGKAFVQMRGSGSTLRQSTLWMAPSHLIYHQGVDVFGTPDIEWTGNNELGDDDFSWVGLLLACGSWDFADSAMLYAYAAETATNLTLERIVTQLAYNWRGIAGFNTFGVYADGGTYGMKHRDCLALTSSMYSTGPLTKLITPEPPEGPRHAPSSTEWRNVVAINCDLAMQTVMQLAGADPLPDPTKIIDGVTLVTGLTANQYNSVGGSGSDGGSGTYSREGEFCLNHRAYVVPSLDGGPYARILRGRALRKAASVPADTFSQGWWPGGRQIVMGGGCSRPVPSAWVRDVLDFLVENGDAWSPSATKPFIVMLPKVIEGDLDIPQIDHLWLLSNEGQTTVRGNVKHGSATFGVMADLAAGTYSGSTLTLAVADSIEPGDYMLETTELVTHRTSGATHHVRREPVRVTNVSGTTVTLEEAIADPVTGAAPGDVRLREIAGGMTEDLRLYNLRIESERAEGNTALTIKHVRNLRIDGLEMDSAWVGADLEGCLDPVITGGVSAKHLGDLDGAGQGYALSINYCRRGQIVADGDATWEDVRAGTADQVGNVGTEFWGGRAIGAGADAINCIESHGPGSIGCTFHGHEGGRARFGNIDWPGEIRDATFDGTWSGSELQIEGNTHDIDMSAMTGSYVDVNILTTSGGFPRNFTLQAAVDVTGQVSVGAQTGSTHGGRVTGVKLNHTQVDDSGTYHSPIILAAPRGGPRDLEIGGAISMTDPANGNPLVYAYEVLDEQADEITLSGTFVIAEATPRLFVKDGPATGLTLFAPGTLNGSPIGAGDITASGASFSPEFPG